MPIRACNEKPVATEMCWKVQETTQLYQGHTFLLTKHTVALPSGDALHYEYEQRAPAVIIIPVTADGQIILIRQYRYPVDRWCLETPAGSSHDVDGMPLQDLAQKELHEEVGGHSDQFEHVGTFHPAPSYADEVCHIYIAWDTTLTTSKEPEPAEAIHVHRVSIPHAISAAITGEISTGPCALAILRCQPLLEKRFPGTATGQPGNA